MMDMNLVGTRCFQDAGKAFMKKKAFDTGNQYFEEELMLLLH